MTHEVLTHIPGQDVLEELDTGLTMDIEGIKAYFETQRKERKRTEAIEKGENQTGPDTRRIRMTG